MFLEEFGSTDLQRQTKRVFKAAYREPVIITRQRGEAAVLMSKKHFAKLIKNQK